MRFVNVFNLLGQRHHVVGLSGVGTVYVALPAGGFDAKISFERGFGATRESVQALRK
jgi:hypothetical protein